MSILSICLLKYHKISKRSVQTSNSILKSIVHRKRQSLNIQIVFCIAQVDIQNMPMELGAQYNCTAQWGYAILLSKPNCFQCNQYFQEIWAYELYAFWYVFHDFFVENLLRPMTFMENDHNISPRIIIPPITINVIAATGFRPRSNLLSAFDAGWIVMDHLTTKR